VASFAIPISDLERDGPIVEVHIGVGSAVEDALRKARAPVPPPVRAMAMIDTGASGTAIQQGLIASLGLNPVGVFSLSI
jgi:hypothetical protein